jgi:spore maturation protein CgeB
MLDKPHIAYFAHSVRSDWNNGNAHFLRGLIRGLGKLGHDPVVFEPREEWSIQNLRLEPSGAAALDQFAAEYPDLQICPYDVLATDQKAFLSQALKDFEVVILHEWNPPWLAHTLLTLRDEIGYKLLFHDTHHRASSSPEQILALGVSRFDGVLVFGEALRTVYCNQFDIHPVWTLHEAADTTVFRPRPGAAKLQDVVWIGNWGDNERSREIREFLLEPASRLADSSFTVFGVRYPHEGLSALQASGVRYAGYLPNLEAPATYAASRVTVHIPRQQYATEMPGIPTIRVFEALACGIPLISAPWRDVEGLFREDDFLFVSNTEEMRETMEYLLKHPRVAAAQALRGLETVLARHTCLHRANELSSICEEIAL